MVNEFPIMNIHNEMYSQNLEQIRAKYKQVTLFIVYIIHHTTLHYTTLHYNTSTLHYTTLYSIYSAV